MREAAEKSMVLLKNESILPINSNQRVVFCGPMIDSDDIIGEWAGRSTREDVISIAQALKNKSTSWLVSEDVQAIQAANVVVMALGEASEEAGEGNSKTNLYLSKEQREYFRKVYALNENIVLVLFAGRPLMISEYSKLAKAILFAYQPGIQGGPAVVSLLSGEKSPSGKLTMTFPYHEGQIPIYYNHYQTGRPIIPEHLEYRYNSHYRDCQNDPLYPFGYGLSYGHFIYKDFRINQQILKEHDKLIVEIDVFNDSQYHADEIVQCYIEALVFSVSRPVNELKRFKRVSFEPYETQTISFALTIEDFRSFNLDMNWTAEHRFYKIKIGPNSRDLKEKKVEVFD